MTPLGFRTGGWSLWRWRKKLRPADNRNKFRLGIIEKSSGRLIGFEIIRINEAGVASLMIAIGDKSWWGKGVVLETRSALLDFLFNVRECRRIAGSPSAHNYPAVFNYQRLGFTHEGTLRKHVLGVRGEENDDLLMFGLLREEWQATRTEASPR